MKILRKDGEVSKSYAIKLWSFVTKTNCLTFNKEISDEDFLKKTEEFYEMVNEIRK